MLSILFFGITSAYGDGHLKRQKEAIIKYCEGRLGQSYENGGVGRKEKLVSLPDAVGRKYPSIEITEVHSRYCATYDTGLYFSKEEFWETGLDHAENFVFQIQESVGYKAAGGAEYIAEAYFATPRMRTKEWIEEEVRKVHKKQDYVDIWKAEEKDRSKTTTTTITTTKWQRTGSAPIRSYAK